MRPLIRQGSTDACKVPQQIEYGGMTAETEHLTVSYEQHGPADGPPILLLHGWPYDVRSWDAVVPPLVAAGHRVLVPYLRGFGPTRFRHDAAPRTTQPTALAEDAAQLLDALGIAKAVVVGHDWGARTGYYLAALWPERVERLVAIAVAYETGVPPGSRLDYRQQQAFWYQWFFASERAREALTDNRNNFCRYLWQTWSPTWRFTEDEFATTAGSWYNPDWVEITLHSYRVRWGNAAPDLRYAQLESRMKQHPTITVPTVHLHGATDGCCLAEVLEDQSASFSGGYRRQILPGVGHCPPRESPEVIVQTILGAK